MTATGKSVPHVLLRAAVDVQRAGSVLTAEIQRLEDHLRAIREWCDQCEADETFLGAVAEVRALLPKDAS